jgi:hypothetical protein
MTPPFAAPMFVSTGMKIFEPFITGFAGRRCFERAG